MHNGIRNKPHYPNRKKKAQTGGQPGEVSKKSDRTHYRKAF